jgi:ubiquinone/menaquinone biosynthesis C-methylase UbiE
MKKDLFGYENQGKKYDLYRPQYPKTLLEALIKRIKHRNRYIDVATGTGQILF